MNKKMDMNDTKRYELIQLEGNKVKVFDKVIGATYFGEVVNGYARSDRELHMKVIAKALRQ